MDIAKAAIYSAYEKLFLFKHHNEGRLPQVVLKNLLPGEPSRNSQHVIICISGWLSENSDKEQEWAHMTEYVKDSGSALFTLSWESKKPWNLVQGAGSAALKGV